MTASPLILRRACDRRADDYDVLHQGRAVGRIYLTPNLVGAPWFWSLYDRVPGASGVTTTREEAMAALRQAWDRRG